MAPNIEIFSNSTFHYGHSTVFLLIRLSLSTSSENGGGNNDNSFLDPFSLTPTSALFCLSRCSYDIDKLKQDAMMHCWVSEMSLFDLDEGVDLF